MGRGGYDSYPGARPREGRADPEPPITGDMGSEHRCTVEIQEDTATSISLERSFLHRIPDSSSPAFYELR